jgi:outer membrane immunogenic protein
LALTVVAGPEPLPSGKEMKQVAPAPVAECFNWTGFYVGGFGGFKFASVDTNLEATGLWFTSPVDKDSIDAHTANNLDADGGEVGGLLGYNYQWHCWVFGVEADGGYLWSRDSFDSGTFATGGLATDKSIQQAFKTHYLSTFGGRLGYSLGRWLPYVTGGLALGDIDYETRLHNVAPNGVYFSSGEKSNDNAGWMVGGGLQYALTDHWSVRAQYQYVDLGSVSFDQPGSAGFVGFSTHSEAELREHNASFALMYKF